MSHNGRPSTLPRIREPIHRCAFNLPGSSLEGLTKSGPYRPRVSDFIRRTKRAKPTRSMVSTRPRWEAGDGATLSVDCDSVVDNLLQKRPVIISPDNRPFALYKESPAFARR